MATILNKIADHLIPRVYADASTIVNLPAQSKWTSFDSLLNDILKYLVWFSIAACFIFFSIGALQYIFGTDPSQLNKSKSAMLWSALGLFVIIAGYVLLKWVGGIFGYTSIF